MLSTTHTLRDHRRDHLDGFFVSGLVGVVLCLVPCAATATEDLTRARAILQTGFSEASVTRLRPLLPLAGRVAISLRSLGTGDGYFSPDQCFYLLGELFERVSVKSFTLAGPGKAPSAGDRHRTLGYLVIRLPDGGDRSLEIRFLLARENGAWRLREVRENYRD